MATIALAVSVVAAPVPARVDITCGGQRVTETGTPGNDTLRGTAGNDVIHGLGGDDQIYGLAGNDIVCGGAGNDLLRGGTGSDTLYGGQDNDRLFGGPGEDLLVGGPGGNVCQTGEELSGCLPGVTTSTTSVLTGTTSAVGVPTTTTTLAPTTTTTTALAMNPTDAVLYPGEDWQRAVNANPAGTAFVVKAGTHRMQSVSPKSGDSFSGEPGAVMTGARLLTSFTQAGGYWYIAGQTQQGPVAPAGWCETGYGDGCRYSEDLFFDDQILWHVRSRGELAPGRWFFDYDADTVWLADNPAGHVVEIGVTQYAFTGFGSDVTIRGLVVEHYASDVQAGAIRTVNGSRWRIENNEVRHNHSAGILAGDHDRIVGNYLHHNGSYGLSVWMGEDTLIEGNEIAYNNIAGFDPGWDAGGTKFSRAVGLIIRNNWVHHNHGNGFWSDGNNFNTLYENNIITDNSRDGIEYEISYNAVIRNNTVERNGRFGIYVLDSPNVEVYGNTVRGNIQRAISGIYDPSRGSGDYGPWELRNLYVHDNYIDMAVGGYIGIWNLDVDDDVYDSWGNVFNNNHYRLGSNPEPYCWRSWFWTAAEWVAHGNDTTGTWE